MLYNDAEAAMKRLEDEYPKTNIAVNSYAQEPTGEKRDYGVSFELAFPLDVSELAPLDRISQEIKGGEEGTVVTTDGGIRIEFR